MTMKNLSLLAPLFAVALSSVAIAADKPFPGIEHLMTAREYQAAGLDKLSPAERAALNRWLISYTVDEAPAMRSANAEVKAADKAHVIAATIRQPFSGWRGDTVFHLDNGQVWRQRLPGHHAYNGDDTRVTISKNFLGFYQLTLTATGKSIGVSRIK